MSSSPGNSTVREKLIEIGVWDKTPEGRAEKRRKEWENGAKALRGDAWNEEDVSPVLEEAKQAVLSRIEARTGGRFASTNKGKQLCLELDESIADMGVLAIAALAEILGNSGTSPRTRVEVAKYVLDRTLGKPTEKIENTSLSASLVAMDEGVKNLGIVDTTDLVDTGAPEYRSRAHSRGLVLLQETISKNAGVELLDLIVDEGEKCS